MMTMCSVRVLEEEQEKMNPVLTMFKDERQQQYQIIDYLCLRKYSEHNKHFSMKRVTVKEGQKEQAERCVGYNCKYQYETHEVKLEYNISTKIWTLIADKYHKQEQQLNALIERINKFSKINSRYTLDEQIQYILEVFDGYFFELDQVKEAERNKEEISKSSLAFGTQSKLMCVHHGSIELSSTNSENDELESQEDSNFSEEQKVELEEDMLDHDSYSSITRTRSQLNDLKPPPIVPPRNQNNNACNTQDTVRYVFFIPPPPLTPVRRRRVIESIFLHVRRKKNIFDKIVDIFRGTQQRIIWELGLEFLRVYNGKFNYGEGYKFVMSFQKKVWFLTIKRIKYVDCPVGEIGPRSVLMLDYNGQFTSVHI